jgi:hypothetical protein
MSSGALPPSAPMWTSAAGSAFGSSRRRRSCGAMGSNFGGRGGDSAAGGQRNRLPCSERSVSPGFFLHLTFATRKPLNKLAAQKPSKVLRRQYQPNSLCRVGIWPLSLEINRLWSEAKVNVRLTQFVAPRRVIVRLVKISLLGVRPLMIVSVRKRGDLYLLRLWRE